MSDEEIVKQLNKFIEEGKKVFKKIERIINYTDLLHSPDDKKNINKYINWKNRTLRFLLQSIFVNDKYVVRFENIVTKPLSKSSVTKKEHQEMIAILESIKEYPTEVKINKDKKKEINITQNQMQIQHIELNMILESIQKEIGEDAFNEIKNVVDSEKDAKKAKTKIFEKFKSFGVDTVSNILANIITNPNIWN